MSKFFPLVIMLAAFVANIKIAAATLNPDDMTARLKYDYRLSRDALFKEVSHVVRDLTPEEFDRWIAEGRFDGRMDDGTMYYVRTSASNLFFRYPSLMSRRMHHEDDTIEQKGRLEVSRQIKNAALKKHTPYVLPHRFVCTMNVTLDENLAPPGETVRAWLPIPREYPFQNEFKLIKSSPAVKELEPGDSPIRSAYFERQAVAEQATEFSMTYGFTRYGIYFDLKPETSVPVNLSEPFLKKFTSEAPHVVFSDKIKALAKEIAGPETNQLLEARAFYDWVTTHIQYSFAREYSTLGNISDYCLTNHYGDCGQEALLFITLCRSQGIPARWQSGWDIWPNFEDIHDWSEIYLAPYGWVPVDAWAGLYATQYCTALKDSERRELHDFYFGGLDYYRMAANCDHSRNLSPPKESPRSDDVDFQRGEFEYHGTNIYFGKFSYDLNVEDLK